MQTVVPLLSFHLSDDVKKKALTCVSQLVVSLKAASIEASQETAQTAGTTQKQQQAQAMLNELLWNTVERIYKCMEVG